MQLTLDRVTKKVGAQTWLYEQSIASRPCAGRPSELGHS